MSAIFSQQALIVIETLTRRIGAVALTVATVLCFYYANVVVKWPN